MLANIMRFRSIHALVAAAAALVIVVVGRGGGSEIVVCLERGRRRWRYRRHQRPIVQHVNAVGEPRKLS